VVRSAGSLAIFAAISRAKVIAQWPIKTVLCLKNTMRKQSRNLFSRIAANIAKLPELFSMRGD
jgi:hypothetical protein